jgi:ring-1,2-phenylacetyl-CoA epoxidase subunit PaaD
MSQRSAKVDTAKPDVATVRRWLTTVSDPEIPVLSLEDLGVLRDIQWQDDTVVVTLSPTYTGCPAMDRMRADIEQTLRAKGIEKLAIRKQLQPAWSTDWISQKGLAALQAYGIAPPVRSGEIHCPQCGSAHTSLISRFGSTACKALYKCEDCLEPFDHFKCH